MPTGSVGGFLGPDQGEHPGDRVGVLMGMTVDA